MSRDHHESYDRRGKESHPDHTQDTRKDGSRNTHTCTRADSTSHGSNSGEGEYNQFRPFYSNAEEMEEATRCQQEYELQREGNRESACRRTSNTEAHSDESVRGSTSETKPTSGSTNDAERGHKNNTKQHITKKPENGKDWGKSREEELENELTFWKRETEHWKQESEVWKQEEESTHRRYKDILQNKEAELFTIQRNIDSTHRKNTTLEREKSELDQEKKKLQRKLDDLEKEKNENVTKLKHKIESLKQEKQKELEKLKRKHDLDIQVMRSNHEETLAMRSKDVEVLKKEIEKERANRHLEQEKYERTKTQMQEEINEKQKNSLHIRELQSEVDRMRNENSYLNQTINDMRKKLDIYVEGKNALEKEIFEKGHKIEEMKLKIEWMQNDNERKIRETDDAVKRECAVIWEARTKADIKELQDRTVSLQRQHEREIDDLRQEAEDERKMFQKKHGGEIQAMMQDINRTHKHYRGQIDFMRRDMEEDKRRMERKHESMMQTGEKLLARRDQEVNELMEAQQRTREFLLQNEFRPRYNSQQSPQN